MPSIAIHSVLNFQDDYLEATGTILRMYCKCVILVLNQKTIIIPYEVSLNYKVNFPPRLIKFTQNYSGRKIQRQLFQSNNNSL
jgi:hypothetical protein